MTKNLKHYKIKFMVKGECYVLPYFDNELNASLRYRELLEEHNTIDIFLYCNEKLIDSDIKYNGKFLS